MKEGERKAGVEGVPYARVPFVFGVHRSVKATGITLREVAAIYAGKKTTWDDGSPIRLILRQEGESDLDILRGMSREMAAAVNLALRRKGMIYAMNDHESADAIERTPGAFGALTLTMVTLENRSIRVLPWTESSRPGSRSTTASILTPRTSSSSRERQPPARQFIEFARSREGAAILSGAGFVPMK